MRLLLAVLLVGLGGGQAAAPPAMAPAAEPAASETLQTMLRLVRHRWQLVDARDARGQPIPSLLARPGEPLLLDFNASVVSIGNACRVLSAHHRLQGNRLSIAAFVSGGPRCSQPQAGALDAAVAKHLQGEWMLHFEAAAEDQLVLADATGVRLRFVALPLASGQLQR